MKFWILLIMLLFLVACSGELPPPPPPPGGSAMAGQAIGGIPISAEKLPSWAAHIQHTDITPKILKEDEKLKVTVEKPEGLETVFYAYGFMYYYNSRDNVWSKVSADVSESGEITSQWAEDRAVFSIEATDSKFDYGNNFLVTYWCIDSEDFDEAGDRIWICNNNKWGLGAFRMEKRGYPEFLIENDIGTNDFNASIRTVVENGVQYEAVYHGTKSVDYARVLKLDNLQKYKNTLAQNIALLRSIWTTRGDACGFYQQDQKIMSWISGDFRVAVQSPDVEKIRAYADMYPPDCTLIEELERISEGLRGYCGNGIVEKPEHCDFNNDTACPGACRPDCTCSFVGEPNSGRCGDLLLQRPNANGFNEECEPIERRDPVTGQIISGSSCFVRDNDKITDIGHCNHACKCVPGIISLPECGDGSCRGDETFESCPKDCINDSELPNISFVKPSVNATINSTSVSFEINATDNFGIAWCELNFDVKLARSNNTWSGEGLFANGSHIAKAACVDISGKEKVLERSFAVNVSADNTTPDIKVLSPDEGEAFDNSVNYKIKATDSSGVKACAAFTDGAEQAMMLKSGSEYTLQRTFSAGGHTVRFECSDVFGNKAEVERDFVVKS